jgi:hypothetical protein
MSEDLALDVLTDFFNAVEAGITQARQRLKEAKVEGKPKWDPSQIKWVEADGTHGKYERSEDVNSLDFKELMKDLEAHDNKLSRDGFFYWKFERSAIIGRKKRK